MKEILFKGKSIESGEWVLGGVVKREGHFSWIYPLAEETLSFEKLVQVITESIGQYVDREDADYIKIFEHDIVVDASRNKAKIIWNEEECQFLAEEEDGELHIIGDWCLVTGNSFDEDESYGGGHIYTTTVGLEETGGTNI